MIRKLLVILLLVALIAPLAACSDLLPSSDPSSQQGSEGGGESSDDSAPMPKTTEDAYYYNAYLDLTVFVPADYYVVRLSEDNLSIDPADTANADDLTWHDYGDEGFGLSLLRLQNKRSDSNSGHAMLDLYAEDYADLAGGFDEYWEDFQMYVDYDGEDGYKFESQETGTTEKFGRTWRTINRVISHPENTDEFCEIYLVTELSEGTYLVAFINYWVGNEESETAAYYMLDSCFSFGNNMPDAA